MLQDVYRVERDLDLVRGIITPRRANGTASFGTPGRQGLREPVRPEPCVGDARIDEDSAGPGAEEETWRVFLQRLDGRCEVAGDEGGVELSIRVTSDGDGRRLGPVAIRDEAPGLGYSDSCIFSRARWKRCFNSRKATMTSGSNWVPAPSSIMRHASSCPNAGR